MGLVDANAFRIWRARVLELVAFRLGRVPQNSIVDGGDTQFLGDSFDPGRYALNAFTVWEDKGDFDFGVVSNSWNSISGWKGDLPDTKRVFGQRGGVSIPLIEFANEEGLLGIGSPFSVGDVSIGRECEAKLFISTTEFFEPAFCLVDGLDPLLSLCETGLEGVFEWR